MLFRAEREVGGLWVVLDRRAVRCGAPAPVSGWWTGPVRGCRSFLRRAGRHGVLGTGCGGGINQAGRPRRRSGGHDTDDPRPPRWVGCSRRRCRGPGGGEAADMVIAQAVEHQGNQFAGGGGDTDVAAAPGADATYSTDSPAVCTTACKPTALQRADRIHPLPTPTPPTPQLDKLSAWDVSLGRLSPAAQRPAVVDARLPLPAIVSLRR